MSMHCSPSKARVVYSSPLNTYISIYRLYEDQFCFDAAQSVYDRPVPVKVSAASPLVGYHPT